MTDVRPRPPAVEPACDCHPDFHEVGCHAPSPDLAHPLERDTPDSIAHTTS